MGITIEGVNYTYDEILDMDLETAKMLISFMNEHQVNSFIKYIDNSLIETPIYLTLFNLISKL